MSEVRAMEHRGRRRFGFREMFDDLIELQEMLEGEQAEATDQSIYIHYFDL